MKIILSSVTKGEQGENLPETSLVYQSGGVTVAAVETAARPTVLALIATGRMAPDSGTVAIVDTDDADELAGDGGASADDAGAAGTREDDALNDVSPDTDAPFAIDGLNAESDADTGTGTDTETGADAMARLRAATAIVDAPDVSEPVGDLKFSAVVQEELMFADRPSGRRATADALAELRVSEFGGWETQNVPTAVRLRVLSELAASRPGVEAIVLTAPDRRGSDPFGWWAIAADLAHRGLAVLVIASPASVDLLAETSARFEADRVADVARRAAATRTTEAARRAALAAPEPAAPRRAATPRRAEATPAASPTPEQTAPRRAEATPAASPTPEPATPRRTEATPAASPTPEPATPRHPTHAAPATSAPATGTTHTETEQAQA